MEKKLLKFLVIPLNFSNFAPRKLYKPLII